MGLQASFGHLQFVFAASPHHVPLDKGGFLCAGHCTRSVAISVDVGVGRTSVEDRAGAFVNVEGRSKEI
jgi:hypothetical protein